jgi:hypothetical protein
VARSETADTSEPPVSVTICLPRDPPLAHFENKEVSTILHFLISCLSQGNLDHKHWTARQTGPWWISRNVGLRNSYSRINDCTSLSNIRFSKKSGGLEISQNSSQKTMHASSLPSRKWPKWPTTVQERNPPTCANTLLTLINITYNNNSRPCRPITTNFPVTQFCPPFCHFPLLVDQPPVIKHPQFMILP